MATAQWSVGNADFYLKVLLVIDAEIVDRELPRTVDEQAVITFYKDAIRERCVAQLVESLYSLLNEHAAASKRNAEIACQALACLGAYVSWVDINLVVNERFVAFFAYALGEVELRESACACLECVIDKRMEMRAKLKLVDYVWKDVLESSFAAIDTSSSGSSDEHNSTAGDNSDYLLNMGKLLNTLGENLFDGWQRHAKKEPELAAALAKCLESKMPHALRLFNHSDDDISESVSDYCMHYISVLKVSSQLRTRDQEAYIESMLHIVVRKSMFDESSFNFESEGEDEAMFLEYRKNIRLVFDAIAALHNDFVLDAVRKLVLNVCAASAGGSGSGRVATTVADKPYAECENALYLLYLIGEAIPTAQGNHFQPRSPKSDCLCEMIQATVRSNIVHHPHRIVKLQYFENVTRYYRFFHSYPHLIEQVLEHFIGPYGLHNADTKLRSRVSYLFSRFTKDLK